MAKWVMGGPPQARQLIAVRAIGEELLTWADLLAHVLQSVQVCVLFFPSRFDTAIDQSCIELLRTFGNNTSGRTSVNFWNPRDENFETALELFGLQRGPAVVLTTGRELTKTATGVDDAGLYSIAFTEPESFANESRFISAMNVAHHLMMGADPDEIAGFIRKQNRMALLEVVGRITGHLVDRLVMLKPKLGLPGGVSISVG